MKRLIIFLIVFVFLIPISYSDGGCVKVEDDMLVQMSAVPLVPTVGQQVSFLFSFANLKKEPIYKDITGKLRIVKNDNTIFTKNFTAKNGILDLKHTFNEPGFYEIFLEFKIGNKSYAPEDFLIEVKEENQNYPYYFLILIVGVFIGALLTRITRKKIKNSGN